MLLVLRVGREGPLLRLYSTAGRAGGLTPSSGACSEIMASAWKAARCSASFLLRPRAWLKCWGGGDVGVRG